jgi:Zn-dependent protease
MLLNEPAETSADVRFSLLGFPVRVHPLFWLAMAIFGLPMIESRDGLGALGDLLLWTIAAFLSILVHELGHALLMRWHGYQPTITLYGFGGYASYDSVRMPSPTSQVFISGAGPAAQLALMVVLAVVLHVCGHSISIYEWGPFRFALPARGEMIYTGGMTTFVYDLMLASALWAYFNLVPVYPLDGGRIARAVLVMLNPREGVRLSLVLSIIIGVGLIILGFVAGQHFLAFFFIFTTCANLEALQADLH